MATNPMAVNHEIRTGGLYNELHSLL